MHPTPWHFWPLLTFAFVWHLVGVIDYTATQFELEFWMSMVSNGQERFIDRMPDWIDGIWAVAVWAGLAGVVLMAFRTSFSPLVLAISMFAMIVLTGWFIGWSSPTLMEVAGQVGLWILLGSCLIAVLLWLYARTMKKAGVID